MSTNETNIMSDEFCETLIGEVRNCPCLWNLTLRDYRDPKVKQKCWGTIGRNLNSSASYCKEKWNYLRERYGKVRKIYKTSPPANGSEWKFYYSMLFLDDHVKIRTGPSSIRMNFTPTMVSRRSPIKRNFSPDESFSNVLAAATFLDDDCGEDSSQQLPVKRHRISNEISDATFSDHFQLNRDEDEDLLYGRLVAKSLKRYPDVIKSRIKVEIMMAFQKADESMQHRIQPVVYTVESETGCWQNSSSNSVSAVQDVQLDRKPHTESIRRQDDVF